MDILCALIVGGVIGMLVGIALVWDRQFNAGRRYGYAQGREWREDQDALSRIRSMM